LKKIKDDLGAISPNVQCPSGHKLDSKIFCKLTPLVLARATSRNRVFGNDLQVAIFTYKFANPLGQNGVKYWSQLENEFAQREAVGTAGQVNKYTYNCARG
jgi:hypothetical protein